MKFYLISDNIDTQMGMRLAGIEGVVVHSPEEIKDALDRAMKMEDVGIVLMTEKAVQQVRETVYDYKLSRKQPLIVRSSICSVKSIVCCLRFEVAGTLRSGWMKWLISANPSMSFVPRPDMQET